MLCVIEPTTSIYFHCFVLLCCVRYFSSFLLFFSHLSLKCLFICMSMCICVHIFLLQEVNLGIKWSNLLFKVFFNSVHIFPLWLSSLKLWFLFYAINWNLNIDLSRLIRLRLYPFFFKWIFFLAFIKQYPENLSGNEAEKYNNKNVIVIYKIQKICIKIKPI